MQSFSVLCVQFHTTLFMKIHNVNNGLKIDM